MKLKNRLVVAVFLACSTRATVTSAWAMGPVPVLQQIVDGLRIQQKAVRSLRVKVVADFSSLNRDRTALQSVGSRNISAIYTIGGRFRMHVHSVSGGYNILAPVGLHLSRRFMAMDYVAAYNGRVGTFYNIKAGYVGKVSPSQTGQVSGEPPPVAVDDLRWTGRSYSIWGLPQSLDWAAIPNQPGYQEMSLLNFLENPPPNSHISAKFVHVQSGHPKVVLTVTWLSRDIIELDPKLNFSVLWDKRYFAERPPQKPNGRVRWHSTPGNTFRVIGFWNPAPGVYYPKKIVDNFFLRRIRFLGPVTQNTLIIKKVSVNDPKVDANTFVFHFPTGTVVTDEATGQILHIGGTPQEQMQAIEKDAKLARKQFGIKRTAKGGNK